MAQLTIIVTSYNIEQYIEACLDSIVEQTLADLEIIVVDDGSSDRTPEIIREYAARDERIVPILCEENSIGGVATPANIGLDAATSPLIGFADGDDLYERDMFEKLVTAIEAEDADLAMCQYKLLEEETDRLLDPAESNRWEALPGLVVDLDEQTRPILLKFIAVPWRKLYRRSLIEDNGLRFPVGDYFFEDNPFHWFNIISADRIVAIPEVLCYHRVGRQGQTMASGDRRLLKIFEHHASIKAFLDERDLTHTYAPTLLLWIISQAEWVSRRLPADDRDEFVAMVAGIFEQYEPGDIDRAFASGEKGGRARDLVDAIASRRTDTLDAVLDGPANPGGTRRLADRFVHHLKTGGPRQALAVTKRYTMSRTRADAAPVLPRRQRPDTTTDDVMLALVLLEERLDHLERLVTEIAVATRAEPAEDGE